MLSPPLLLPPQILVPPSPRVPLTSSSIVTLLTLPPVTPTCPHPVPPSPPPPVPPLLPVPPPLLKVPPLILLRIPACQCYSRKLSLIICYPCRNVINAMMAVWISTKNCPQQDPTIATSLRAVITAVFSLSTQTLSTRSPDYRTSTPPIPSIALSTFPFSPFILA